jgi:hypothetical protein
VIEALSARHSRAADSTRVSSTLCKSNTERLITLSASAVAACCSRASLSSRASLRTSVSGTRAKELLWRAAFKDFTLRLRALANLLLALERRRIAHPKAQDHASRIDDYSRDLRLAK